MGRVRQIRWRRVRGSTRRTVVDLGVGRVAVAELVDRLGVIKLLDAAIGSMIKARDRGRTAS